jgi:hypothetical protein
VPSIERRFQRDPIGVRHGFPGTFERGGTFLGGRG